MSAVLAIARATVLELRRQRLLIVPIIGFVLSLVVLGAALVLTDGNLDLRDDDAEVAALVTGIAACVGGTVYALIVGAGLIAREIVAGTMLMLAARPIGRWQIIAGRALGSAAFLLAVLLAVCTSYALVAALASGSTAPLDEPFVAFIYGAPAVLLGLCFGIACSIQGKATAATGTAIGLVLFAWSVGIYADDWRTERHERSFLTEEVRDRIDSNDAIVGPAATGVARALPFWVLMRAALDAVDDRERYQYGGPLGRGERIYPKRQGAAIYGMTTARPVDPGAMDAPAGVAPMQPRRLPADPPAAAFQCAEYGGASCFYGYENAWRVDSYRASRPMHEGVGLLLAWLAIPAWVGVAMLLLHRRRDLT